MRYFGDLAERPCLDPPAVRRRSARYPAPLSRRLPLRSLPRRQLSLLQRTGGCATRWRQARVRPGLAGAGPHPKPANGRIGYRAIAAAAGLAKSTMILTGSTCRSESIMPTAS